MSPDLQADLCSGARSGLSPHPVLGPRVIPQTQLREGALEMSGLQVRTSVFIILQMFDLRLSSKPALLEGLEVDQYMWSVIQSPQVKQSEYLHDQ